MLAAANSELKTLLKCVGYALNPLGELTVLRTPSWILEKERRKREEKEKEEEEGIDEEEMGAVCNYADIVGLCRV